MYLIDLIFPPLVSLLLGLLLSWAWTSGPFSIPACSASSPWLLPVHGLMAVVLACYALSPLFALDLPVRYLASLIALPYYAVWKLLTIRGKPTAWVRTPREPVPSDAIG